MPTLETTFGAQNMTLMRATSTPWLAPCTLAMEAMATGMVVTGVGVKQTSSMWIPMPCVQSQGGFSF